MSLQQKTILSIRIFELKINLPFKPKTSFSIFLSLAKKSAQLTRELLAQNPTSLRFDETLSLDCSDIDMSKQKYVNLVILKCLMFVYEIKENGRKSVIGNIPVNIQQNRGKGIKVYRLLECKDEQATIQAEVQLTGFVGTEQKNSPSQISRIKHDNSRKKIGLEDIRSKEIKQKELLEEQFEKNENIMKPEKDQSQTPQSNKFVSLERKSSNKKEKQSNGIKGQGSPLRLISKKDVTQKNILTKIQLQDNQFDDKKQEEPNSPSFKFNFKQYQEVQINKNTPKENTSTHQITENKLENAIKEIEDQKYIKQNLTITFNLVPSDSENSSNQSDGRFVKSQQYKENCKKKDEEIFSKQSKMINREEDGNQRKTFGRIQSEYSLEQSAQFRCFCKNYKIEKQLNINIKPTIKITKNKHKLPTKFAITHVIALGFLNATKTLSQKSQSYTNFFGRGNKIKAKDLELQKQNNIQDDPTLTFSKLTTIDTFTKKMEIVKERCIFLTKANQKIALQDRLIKVDLDGKTLAIYETEGQLKNTIAELKQQINELTNSLNSLNKAFNEREVKYNQIMRQKQINIRQNNDLKRKLKQNAEMIHQLRKEYNNQNSLNTSKQSIAEKSLIKNSSSSGLIRKVLSSNSLIPINREITIINQNDTMRQRAFTQTSDLKSYSVINTPPTTLQINIHNQINENSARIKNIVSNTPKNKVVVNQRKLNHDSISVASDTESIQSNSYSLNQDNSQIRPANRTSNIGHVSRFGDTIIIGNDQSQKGCFVDFLTQQIDSRVSKSPNLTAGQSFKKKKQVQQSRKAEFLNGKFIMKKRVADASKNK